MQSCKTRLSAKATDHNAGILRTLVYVAAMKTAYAFNQYQSATAIKATRRKGAVCNITGLSVHLAGGSRPVALL